ncbi:putative transcriptional regulator [Tengunoibacter tsumagoiensis]|uniref:Putative transcriptional regulator n=2 Tax=Tengunoibacter tsumagoiensis TaxID=2014871 RepID=A0A401ZXY8_9CHLR|nr:putative transcriptional regulator [Tengunoibacter tsumagoiensis]
MAPLPNTLDEKTTFLAHHELFQQLNPTELSHLASLTTTVSYPPGRILLRPGDPGLTFFLLSSGSIQLYALSTDGRKLILATLTTGACLGELAFTTAQTQQCFAETIAETVLYTLTRADMAALLQRNSTISQALLQIISQRLAQRESQLINTTFKSTTARLSILLLELAHQQSASAIHGLSHEELADRLGVYRETVSTALRELKEAGAIALGRKHITICAPELLQQLAGQTK